MPRKEGYKKKGKSKKSDVGTRAYLVKDQKGNKLDGDRMSRYQVVGKTKKGDIQLEIVVDKYGKKQGVGASKITVSPDRWNISFSMNPPKNYKPVRNKRKEGEAGKTVKRKGQGGGDKKVQGRAAAKIQRAVRRRLKGVKKVRAEQVAKEALVAPELRAELGKTTGAHPIGFNVEVVGTGQEVFEPVDRPRKKERVVQERVEHHYVVNPGTFRAYHASDVIQPEIREEYMTAPTRDDRIFGKNLPYETKLKIATARVGNKQLVLVDESEKMMGGAGRSGMTRGYGKDINSSSYFIRDGWGIGLHKLMEGHSNWVSNYVITLKDVKGEGKRKALTEKELGEEVRDRWRAHPEQRDDADPKFFRNLLRENRLHGFASTYNYNKASKDWRERGGSNK